MSATGALGQSNLNQWGYLVDNSMTAEIKQRRKEEGLTKSQQQRKIHLSQALTAGELAAPLSIHGRGDAYVHYIVAWRVIICRSVQYLLLRNDTVDFCERKQWQFCKFRGYANLKIAGELHITFKTLSLFLPVKMFLKASSTLVESNADVSINERVFFSEDEKKKNLNVECFLFLFLKDVSFNFCIYSKCGAFFQGQHLPAKARASSVGTALRWRRSLLFPTSMMTMLLSAWSLSSFSQRSTFSYVRCLAIS